VTCRRRDSPPDCGSCLGLRFICSPPANTIRPFSALIISRGLYKRPEPLTKWRRRPRLRVGRASRAAIPRVLAAGRLQNSQARTPAPHFVTGPVEACSTAFSGAVFLVDAQAGQGETMIATTKPRPASCRTGPGPKSPGRRASAGGKSCRGNRSRVRERTITSEQTN
jgi:hypothetical protein